MTDKTRLVTDEMIDIAWVRQHQRSEINGVYSAMSRHDPVGKAMADALEQIAGYKPYHTDLADVLQIAAAALAKYKEAVG